MKAKTQLWVKNQKLESCLMAFAYLNTEQQPTESSIHIPLEVAGQSAGFTESWTDGFAVRKTVVDGGFALSTEAHLVLVYQASDQNLKSQVSQVYQHAFQTSAAQGYSHLLRTWNYVHDINGFDAELERYQIFCVARHDVLESMGLLDQPNPAATAIGSYNGYNCFVFLFSKHAGRVIENKRQVSAWQYPKQYSPKQPRFSRAMEQGDLLLCSGTASVVGHATRHLDDFVAQFDECINNVAVLLQSANRSHELTSGLYRFYLRDPMYTAKLQLCIERSGIKQFVILHGAVCRENLLVECEAVFQ